MPNQLISLTEYQPLLLPRATLSEAAAQQLWHKFRAQVEVEPPSFKTGDQWRLTAQGWVGAIPLTNDLTLWLRPKLPVDQLFRALEIVYDLQPIQWGRDLVHVASHPGLVERLAELLAQRTLDRCRKGTYRAYRQRNERLPYLRGRLLIPELLRTPYPSELPCRYEEQSADVAENQIIAWTLHCILRSGICTERSRFVIERAWRALSHTVTLQPFPASACRNRGYTRLNADYAALHALCAFFLENSTPSHEPGENEMIPFLLDMAHLYERLVAQWLTRQLANRYRVELQERFDIDPSAGLHFVMDIALYELATGKLVAILDTKYKAPLNAPAAVDVAQVLAYAQAKGASEAVLVYPSKLAQPLDHTINGIRLRSLTFGLNEDIEVAGQRFLAALGGLADERLI